MIDSELAMFNRPLRRLRSILRAEGQATTSYDFIIIDSAPGVSRLLLNGLVAADQLIIPCTASDLALQGVQKITDSVDRLSAGEDRELDIDMPVRVLFTMFRPTTKIAQAAIKRVTNRYGITPYTTYIRQSVRAAEAPGYHQPLAVYEPSGVSDDYRAFAEEFLNDGQE
jgi:chromosome partitioning protein